LFSLKKILKAFMNQQPLIEQESAVEEIEPKKPTKAEPVNQPTKKPISQPKISNGRDEMNLVEYPFALLSTRANPEVKTIEITKQGTNKNGELVEQKWTVTGSDKWGLPTIVGEEVYIALMALTHQDSFRSKEIHFKGVDLIRQLGWPLNGESYWRLRKALRVLKGVNIYAQNLFYDNKIKDYLPEKAFGIISEYDWYGDDDQTIKVEWGTFLWTSFKNNYIKAIDTGFYFSLSSAIAQRLYRVLDKRFYHKTKVEFDLRELAFNHLLMSRKYHGGKIKERLTPAIEELINTGYLSNFEYQPPKGRTKKVAFYKGKTTQPTTKKTEPKTQTEDTSLVHQLIRFGIPAELAQQLVEKHPDRIEPQIRYHEYRLQHLADKVSKNPAGFLRKAIEGNWTAPADYISPEDREQRARKAEENQKRQEWQMFKDNIKSQIETPPDKLVHGSIFLWSLTLQKEQNRLPTPDEQQAKQQELINALPPKEELINHLKNKYQELFNKPLKDTEQLLFDD